MWVPAFTAPTQKNDLELTVYVKGTAAGELWTVWELWGQSAKHNVFSAEAPCIRTYCMNTYANCSGGQKMASGVPANPAFSLPWTRTLFSCYCPLYTVPEVIDFPRYNAKCSVENKIICKIVGVISCVSSTFRVISRKFGLLLDSVIYSLCSRFIIFQAVLALRLLDHYFSIF